MAGLGASNIPGKRKGKGSASQETFTFVLIGLCAHTLFPHMTKRCQSDGNIFMSSFSCLANCRCHTGKAILKGNYFSFRERDERSGDSIGDEYFKDPIPMYGLGHGIYTCHASLEIERGGRERIPDERAHARQFRERRN